MLERYQIPVNYKRRKRQLLHALLALVTGVLTLAYPNFLYLIAGGYLIVLGVSFLLFRLPVDVAVVPLVAGIIIYAFPSLIPISFAIFLALFGFMLFFTFQFLFVGGVTVLIAILIILNPHSVAYLVATFLLVYAVSNLARWYRGRRW